MKNLKRFLAGAAVAGSGSLALAQETTDPIGDLLANLTGGGALGIVGVLIFIGILIFAWRFFFNSGD